jgi:hypothetical protein
MGSGEGTGKDGIDPPGLTDVLLWSCPAAVARDPQGRSTTEPARVQPNRFAVSRSSCQSSALSVAVETIAMSNAGQARQRRWTCASRARTASGRTT